MVEFEKIMPIINIVISGLAGICYALKCDAGRSIYWLSAALLNYSITFMVK